MPQRQVIYQIMSYMERIYREWPVTAHCCNTMTSNQTSSWHTESNWKDSVLTQSESKTWTSCCKTLGRPKGLLIFTLRQEKSIREQLNTNIVLLPWAAFELKITRTEERILDKFCYICPVLKLICRLFVIVRERFWTKFTFNLTGEKLFMFLCYNK